MSTLKIGNYATVTITSNSTSATTTDWYVSEGSPVVYGNKRSKYMDGQTPAIYQEEGKMRGKAIPGLPLTGDTVRVTKSTNNFSGNSLVGSEGIVVYTSTYGKNQYLIQAIMYKVGDIPAIAKVQLVSNDLIERKGRKFSYNSIRLPFFGQKLIIGGSMDPGEGSVVIKGRPSDPIVVDSVCRVGGRINDPMKSRLLAKLMAVSTAYALLLRSTRLFIGSSKSSDPGYHEDHFNKSMPLHPLFKKFRDSGGNAFIPQIDAAHRMYRDSMNGTIFGCFNEKNGLMWAKERGMLPGNIKSWRDVERYVFYLNTGIHLICKNQHMFDITIGKLSNGTKATGGVVGLKYESFIEELADTPVPGQVRDWHQPDEEPDYPPDEPYPNGEEY